MTTPLAELRLQLEHLGMVVGDTVMVHASMRTVGKVENGARIWNLKSHSVQSSNSNFSIFRKCF